jgi:hypothetical protein
MYYTLLNYYELHLGSSLVTHVRDALQSWAKISMPLFVTWGPFREQVDHDSIIGPAQRMIMLFAEGPLEGVRKVVSFGSTGRSKKYH